MKYFSLENLFLEKTMPESTIKFLLCDTSFFAQGQHILCASKISVGF